MVVVAAAADNVDDGVGLSAGRRSLSSLLLLLLAAC